MIVEQITDVEELTSILKLPDPMLDKQALSKLKCSKAEWVQWIIQYTRNPNFMRVYAVKEGKDIKAYMIAVNAIAPPISRCFLIVYQCFFGMKDEDEQFVGQFAIDEIAKWTLENGSDEINIFTDKPHINEKFGFKTERGVSMVLEL